MKESKKIAIIAALAFIFSGFIIIIVASFFSVSYNFSINDFQNDILTENSFETVTYDINESFGSIIIDEIDAKVKILPSENGNCCVKYKNSRTVSRNCYVKNGVLYLTAKESFNILDHIGFFFWDDYVTEIYVAKDKFDEIKIETISGDIEISDKLAADNFSFHSTSGDICIYNLSCETFYADSTSGEIEIGKSEIGSAVVKITSGDFYLTESEFFSLRCNTVSGHIDLNNTEVKEKTFLSTTSGNITFSDFYSSGISAKTISGSISGSFSKPMNVFAESKSGNISIKTRDPEGPECNLSTTSGNIKIH